MAAGALLLFLFVFRIDRNPRLIMFHVALVLLLFVFRIDRNPRLIMFHVALVLLLFVCKIVRNPMLIMFDVALVLLLVCFQDRPQLHVFFGFFMKHFFPFYNFVGNVHAQPHVDHVRCCSCCCLFVCRIVRNRANDRARSTSPRDHGDSPHMGGGGEAPASQNSPAPSVDMQQRPSYAISDIIKTPSGKRRSDQTEGGFGLFLALVIGCFHVLRRFSLARRLVNRSCDWLVLFVRRFSLARSLGSSFLSLAVSFVDSSLFHGLIPFQTEGGLVVF